ncbi:MAG: DNA primase DnaG [Candidatus Rehaiarchaeum fermentans]|nr:DNA primase DnaG [Candidatus Rehaiarchaeum fermentans]MCW1297228.1 DNA primase DnaG [Candidatus Rehaiarchaeum fermentans]MCW1302250.1 DNA primase DnaG [Candidatus Rehaiarchaeum fermentans]
MAKIGPVSFKYILHIEFSVGAVVDKPDVIGAIFGQTEGILGESLDLREAQRNGRIGRIEVDLHTSEGKTFGEILVPTSLDLAETALIGSTIETVDRIGPAKAVLKVTRIEDVRASKREFILKRAEELLEAALKENSVDSAELVNKIYSLVREKELIEYGPEKLPAGPEIESSDEIIIVEGRADVLNLLRYGFLNVIALNGTSIPKSVIELSKKKTTTLLVDGDRGGDIIITSFLQQGGHADYIAKAPQGMEVEELTKKEINMALRSRIPVEDFLESKDISVESTKKEFPPEIKDKVLHYLQDIRGSNGSILFNKDFSIIGKIPCSQLIEALSNIQDVYMVISDCIINDEVVKAAEESGVKYLIGRKALSSSPNIYVGSFE